MTEKITIQRKLQIKDWLNQLLGNCKDEEERQIINDLTIILNTTLFETTTKTELARLYNISELTLNRRMKQNADLVGELYERFGYNKWRKVLLPAEVECIYKHMGVPPLMQ